MFGRKEEEPHIGGVRIFPVVGMREAGQQYGMFFIFLILPFYALLFVLLVPELVFPPDIAPMVMFLTIGFAAAILIAVESFIYYGFQRWLQGQVSVALYLRSRTKIGKYEARELIRVVGLILLAEPEKKKGKKLAVEVAESGQDAVEIAAEAKDFSNLVLLPDFKTLRIGDKYMYHLIIESGVPSPIGRAAARYGRVVLMPFPWEELGFERDSDIFEYGFFLEGRSTEICMVHVGYMFSVFVEAVVPVFYVYFSAPHKRKILEKNFRIEDEAQLGELLKYIHEADKHQAHSLILRLREVERERDLYKERYEETLANTLEIAEDIASELMQVFLEGVESAEKLFGKSAKEKLLEKLPWIVLMGIGLLGLIILVFLL